MTENTTKKFKRKLEGVVVSDKADKTIAVEVIKRFKHSQYSKFVYTTKKYQVHDEENSAKKGDKVLIIESRPHSKLKRWELTKVFS